MIKDLQFGLYLTQEPDSKFQREVNKTEGSSFTINEKGSTYDLISTQMCQ
jgi:hypothetical protein